MLSTVSQIFVTSLTIIIFVLVTLGLYYIVTRKKYQDKKKHFEQLHLNLKRGDKVEFSNGLTGEVETIGSEYCDIKVKSGAVITVSRFTISRIFEEK